MWEESYVAGRHLEGGLEPGLQARTEMTDIITL